MKGTPFRTSGRVAGEGFFGRSELIRTVIRNLRARNNVAIVGVSRMGKSSLINLMFIDSAERFAEPPFNEEALFAILSSYLPTQNITLCITITVRPEAMLTNRIGFPLHSQFVTCELLPFTAEECEELIQKKLQWTGIHFSPSEIDKLVQESKGHPADPECVNRFGTTLFGIY